MLQLRTECKVVTPTDIEKNKSEIIDVISRMRKYVEDNGVLGIAANQVGSDYRILCYRHKDTIINCINPKIDKQSGRVAVYNTDPSFPNLLCRTVMYNKISVSYIEVGYVLDNRTAVKLKGQEAFVFQQCVNLLNGTIIFDNAMRVKWNSEYKKIYRVVKSDDYFVEGDTKTWFYGIDVVQDMEVQIVGIKLEQPEAEEQPERDRTQQEIDWILNSEEGKVLTPTQRSIILREVIDLEGEISEQETMERTAATLWLHNKVDTEELLNLNKKETQNEN
mgnify:FL=1